MLRWLLLPITILFLMLTWRIDAQAAWSLWAYQPTTHRLLQVDANGSVIHAEQLQIPVGAALVGQPVIAPTGTRAAYIVEANFTQELVLIDLPSMTQRQTWTLTPPLLDVASPDDYFILSENSFNADGTQLAVTEIMGGRGWRIIVIDTGEGVIRHTLNNEADIIAPFPQLDAGAIPLIQSIRGDGVTITLQTSIPPQHHTYTWYYLGNLLHETLAAPTLTGSNLQGDFVHALYDDRFPTTNADITHHYQQQNSLHVYETRQSGRYPFFTIADLSFGAVRFIQGGRRVLVDAYENEFYSWWVVVDRADGEIRRLPIAGYDVQGTPEGFVYATPVGEQTAIVAVDTLHLSNAGSTLWLADGEWRILWAQLIAQTGGYGSWTRLAAPQNDPQSIPSPLATPTQYPAFTPFRSVGMEIQIYMPVDTFINLRDAPSTTSNVLAMLESGVRGTIIDGPVDADGFRWWHVQLVNRAGWLVESLPDNLVLIPPQDLPEATPTPLANAES